MADLERDWSISVGTVYSEATEALVAEAVRADGTLAVLKVLVPRPGDDTANEITVLRLADGAGCVRMLRHDQTRGALLLERLGPSLFDLGLPLPRRQEILCATASRVWRPATDVGLPTGAEKGRALAAFIARHEDQRSAFDYALGCAEHRVAGHDDERAVLVHGDVHQWNALQTADGAGFTLVDPDGLLAEPEYDLGVMMREDPEELMQGDPHQRAYALAARTGLDPTAIWEWGVVERVATGLVLTAIDLQPVARQMLAAADQIAERYSRFP